jgi:site-specific recombinase
MQTYFTTMEESTTAQTAKMEKVFSEQQQILAQKASEVSHLVSELKNLQDVKQTMKNLLEAYREQNRLLTAALNRQASNNGTPLPVEQPPVRLPKWLVGVSILVALSIVAAVALYCLQSFHIIDL